jgi:hypothetical protein
MQWSAPQSEQYWRKDPVFTTVAVGSLAIGIGATWAMFSFADAMLLRPLPVMRPDRVAAINTAISAPFAFNSNISYPDYADLRDRRRSFDGLVAASYAKFGFSPNSVTLQTGLALPLLAITVLATWAPARCASLVDPLRALRDERCGVAQWATVKLRSTSARFTCPDRAAK